MRILAIDPAQKCGWAVASVRKRIDASGVWNLGPDAAFRSARLAEYVRLAVKRHGVTVIAYEVATFGGKRFHVMRRMNELAGAIQAISGQLGIECWAFGITSWKARAVGHGNAKKHGVMRGLRMFYGINVSDDNEADAIGIALSAQQGPPPEPVRKQRSRMAKAAKREPRLFR